MPFFIATIFFNLCTVLKKFNTLDNINKIAQKALRHFQIIASNAYTNRSGANSSRLLVDMYEQKHIFKYICLCSKLNSFYMTMMKR